MGMAEPLALPEFPPDGPWSAYVLLIIWMPLLLRILFLVFPFRKAIKKLAPHTGWALRQLRELPVRGFGILALNEILAFMIPPLIVLVLRLIIDPVGWQSWNDVPLLGIAFLSILVVLWIMLDLFRIFRVRRMLKAIDRYDVEKLRKIADAGLGVRGWLRKFSGKDKQIEPEPTQNRVAKRSAKIWAGRALMAGRLTPQGLLGSLAIGAALEAAKTGAGKITDRIDQKMQEEFDKIAKVNSKTLLNLLIRDFAMGLSPLLALAILPILF